MKRKNNIYNQIISVPNLRLADINARKGKGHQKSIKTHDKNREPNILNLNYTLKTLTYNTSAYKTFPIKEHKERLIYVLPYCPDRITHHAIMQVAKPYFVSTFTADTYSCIKGRGVHKAVYAVKKALKDKPNTTYYLQMDIEKFYPSVKNQILKNMLRRKFKDWRFLKLMDNIIDSAQGLPIGNYISQFLANFYLTYFDHFMKQTLKAIHYFRYADDMVVFSGCKRFLHKLRVAAQTYLWDNLQLKVKPNWRIVPTWCGLNFLGYVFYETYTWVRPRIKDACALMIKTNYNIQSVASYLGWFKHGNCVNLSNKLIYGYAS